MTNYFYEKTTNAINNERDNLKKYLNNIEDIHGVKMYRIPNNSFTGNVSIKIYVSFNGIYYDGEYIFIDFSIIDEYNNKYKIRKRISLVDAECCNSIERCLIIYTPIEKISPKKLSFDASSKNNINVLIKKVFEYIYEYANSRV